MKEKISENFALSEMITTSTSIENKIESLEHYNNLVLLVNNLIQPIRNKFGRIRINSGYRNQAVNKAVGGVQTSQHTKGQAADLKPLEAELRAVFEYVRDNMVFDQLILYPNFIHVSYNHLNNRKQVIIK